MIFVKILKQDVKSTQFLRSIYGWYDKNKRELPWRQTCDPFKIWISEVILQQTRVNQGTDYYLRFTGRFPDIASLASAPETEVLKLWQGLGYYTRARNLHIASKTIMEKYGGGFPSGYNHIIALKGIGEYTAAAIASIAFNLPYPAIDGNVARFLSRYFEIGLAADSKGAKTTIKNIAKEILDIENPGNHNQALMELGATVCTPVQPLCSQCPVGGTCLAFNHHTVGLLPGKRKPIKQKRRYFFFFLIEENGSVYLRQRQSDDIWRNLFELPLIETEKNTAIEEVLFSANLKTFLNGSDIRILSTDGPVTHILTHQKITAHFIHLQKISKNQLPPSFLRVNKKDIHKFAIPRLIEAYLVKSGIL